MRLAGCHRARRRSEPRLRSVAVRVNVYARSVQKVKITFGTESRADAIQPLSCEGLMPAGDADKTSRDDGSDMARHVGRKIHRDIGTKPGTSPQLPERGHRLVPGSCRLTHAPRAAHNLQYDLRSDCVALRPAATIGGRGRGRSLIRRFHPDANMPVNRRSLTPVTPLL